MQGLQRIVLIFLAFIIFASLYVPQPILPYLASFYHTDPVSASRLITRIMLMLCMGSLVGGLLSNYFSSRTLLAVGVSVLAMGRGIAPRALEF